MTCHTQSASSTTSWSLVTATKNTSSTSRRQKKLQDAGLRLNREKCEFTKKEIKLPGYEISRDGILIDLCKNDAIVQIPEPTGVADLTRFIGMVSFLGRHIPILLNILQPQSQLLKKDAAWIWGPPKAKAISQIKIV